LGRRTFRSIEDLPIRNEDNNVVRLALVTLSRIRRRLAGQGGMTLVELMVTLAVVGILMGIAIPTVSTYMARQELKAAARETVSVLRETREAAMNEGMPRYVLFTPAANSYQVWRFNGTAWLAEAAPKEFGAAVTFSDADVPFPALANTPVNPHSVPEHAAYFDTRGRYPFGASGVAASYTITLRSRGGRTIPLTLYTATGQVTGL
jgi:prepilin-type N-terminal cleavage/methylation domain-containing protein